MPMAPRKLLKRREHTNHARFLTFSCRHRLPLLANEGVRDSFVSTLAEKADQAGVGLIAWVIMPEHVHLVVVPPPHGPTDIAGFLRTLKLTHAQRILKRWRELEAPILGKIKEPNGRIRYWQPGGGFDRNVRDHQELVSVVDYIHANPVRRGLVGRADDWKWSSIHMHRSEPVPVRDQ
jgi:putative transposase